ncbi:GGDEF domain-containing protein [Variovorax sp. VNK109]|uniref:GGDEF domain-containing protein n=1 Tax=Variovorax sp. VNK109 TaxID=3400919 RepID=UPI003C059645
MNSAFGDSLLGTSTSPLPLPSRGSRRGHDSVPRHIGQIEPWIGGSLAFYTAWLVAVSFRDQILPWAYVVVAAALAAWSWRRPARKQSELMVRAVLYALLGFLVVTQGGLDVGGSGSQLFFWITVPMVFYAFLLKARLAWGLLAFSVLASLGAMFYSGFDVPFGSVVARTGFLIVFAAAAIRMGSVLRRTDELLESRRVDASSGMLNEYGFVDYGEELWGECRKSGLPATLVFLDVPDLPRLKALYGGKIARQAADKVLRSLQTLSSGKNIVARLGGQRFALFMPGASHEQAMYFVGDKLGHPPQIELDDDGFELIFLVNVHAVESEARTASFAHFFEPVRDMLDFYFSDKPMGEAPSQFQASAQLATMTSDPAARKQPVLDDDPSRWNEVQGGPSTLPISPPTSPRD